MGLTKIPAYAAKIDSITASPYIFSISHQNSKKIGNFTGQMTPLSQWSAHNHLAKQLGIQIQIVHCKKYRKSTVKLQTGQLLIYMAPVMLDGLKHFFPIYEFWNHHVCTNRLIMFPDIFAASTLKCDPFRVWSGK